MMVAKMVVYLWIDHFGSAFAREAACRRAKRCTRQRAHGTNYGAQHAACDSATGCADSRAQRMRLRRAA